jgi:phenylalanyl-tRNA synthetase beta chain
MRVPLSWLREYVEIDLEPDELARRLTMLGMEVGNLERWGDEWRDVVVGELLTVAPHPRADRLSVTTVAVADGSVLEIVCGATNIAPGQRVPVALPGAVLPGDRRIERTEKMGVVSVGMLCSGDELRLTADADGILILPSDTPVGVPLGDLYGDWVLDVDVKPNRGDALSMVGLAREVAATTGAPVRFPETAPVEAGPPVETSLAVEVQESALCPRFVGRRVSGVTMGPAPDAVQMRLLAAGVRPISNVVDASNYVMLELGKPIHTFDGSAVADGRIVVRLARPGERLETLDHVDRELEEDTLLIADRTGPLGIAGVMGGAGSEVSATTTDVIVESAIFDPVSIRRTGQRYGLRSEASVRFEKGQEWRLVALGADRAARLVNEWAGGSVAAGRIDSNPVEQAPRQVAFRPARIDRLLGTTIGSQGQVEQLARVGIEVRAGEPGTRVDVALDPQPLAVEAHGIDVAIALIPTWRHDLAIEADVAEEVARVMGYETVPPVRPHTPMPPFRPAPTALRDRVREMLVGAGLTEVVSHALTSPARYEAFAPAVEVPDVPGEEARGGSPVTVTNPLSRDRSVLRRSLVGSLLEVVAINERNERPDVAVFEVGKGYARHGDGVGEWWRLGIALAGTLVEDHWTAPGRATDLADLKGIVELVAARLGHGSVAYEPATADRLFHPGRAATAVAADHAGAPALAGRVGELHPATLTAWEIRAECVLVAELAIAGLSAGLLPRTLAGRLGAQRLRRDLALVVRDDVAAGRLLSVVRAAGGDAVEEVTLFDIYSGPPLEAGERSLAFRITFGGERKDEDDADELLAAIRAAAEHEVGARPRT